MSVADQDVVRTETPSGSWSQYPCDRAHCLYEAVQLSWRGDQGELLCGVHAGYAEDIEGIDRAARLAQMHADRVAPGAAAAFFNWHCKRASYQPKVWQPPA